MYQILSKLSGLLHIQNLGFISQNAILSSHVARRSLDISLTASLICTDCVSPLEAGTLSYWMVSQYYVETLVCYWAEGRLPNTESLVLLSLAPGIFFGKFPANYYTGQILLHLWDLTRSQPEEIQMKRPSYHYQHPQEK